MTPTTAAPIPTIAIVPFAALLAGIAILPLAVPNFWERNRNKSLVTGLITLPIAIWLLRAEPQLLHHSLLEYVSFICLLGSLFAVAGGIHISGNLEGSPRNNTIMLGVAGVLANLIGTTGASMLMIRLVLRTNSERTRTKHIPFFFILIAANCGGLLTPLGDPPLFLGYLQGVPFQWTLRLWPVWLLAMLYLLTVFFWVDRRAYALETPRTLALDHQREEPIRVHGKRSFLFLFAIVASVFLPSPIREGVMIISTVGSLTLGSRDARRRNEFHLAPIFEVAILFAGIFVTMVPALELLRHHGQSLGLHAPWQFFLASGSLSSVLDNAPTYLTFLAAAQGLSMPADVVGVTSLHLVAISCGSVLMGANTYIGNGPNFMVKAIADASGYRTPSFFGYAARAVAVLLPVYAAVVLGLVLFARH
ncbi:MAG TPA: sodium:proton antiporter [Polyangiaceae bacterium]